MSSALRRTLRIFFAHLNAFFTKVSLCHCAAAFWADKSRNLQWGGSFAVRVL